MQPSSATFCHPYQPYDIQLEFMTGLYNCIEAGKVGILESPTGTGKSLSLICGALTWLRDHKCRSFNSAIPTDSGDAIDWLAQAENTARHEALLRDREELERRLENVRKKEEQSRLIQSSTRLTKKLRLDQPTPNQLSSGEDEFVLDDYQSDDEQQTSTVSVNHSYSDSTQALLDKLRGVQTKQEDDIEVDETKIIFCSRTHSQLTQFINELRRVEPPSSLFTRAQPETNRNPAVEIVKHLPLGSRKNLCINAKVSSSSSTLAINEKCLDLQKPNTPKDDKCPFLPNKEKSDTVNLFRDRSIARIRDIEDISQLGREMGICPYYASRTAIAPTEVLTLPYPLLLQKPAREALGVPIKGNVIIIDEAHNLTDAIANTFSLSMTLSHLELAMGQVTIYAQKFKNRLKGKNRVYLAQLIRVMQSVTSGMSQVSGSMRQQETLVDVAQLMSGKGVDQIQPHKLIRYLQESKLAHKVEGYAALQQLSKFEQPRGILMHFQNFLSVLMNPAAEGRFFVINDENQVSVRYLLLDPQEHFRDIVRDARAVILAGGTMSPMSDYTNYLFSYLQSAELQTFSFGHIVPEENILAEPVTQGPSGQVFDFTYEKRGSETMIVELGRLLVQVCNLVPDGVVVFFPSYDYLAQVVKIWKKPSNGATIHDTLAGIKRIFEESKGVVVEDLLRDYAHSIDSNNGGLMLSVVGGKLSEGINFSDRLGRAVVAVGLPFPNANGAEWKAKMEHVESLRYKQCKEELKLADSEARTRAKTAGREVYENACMRAVNQSIGRAIRHKNDYAAIMLVDRRFNGDRIRSKLPGWIRSSMADSGDAYDWRTTELKLRKFFAVPR